jgi:2-oxoglutarate dehydrogenase E2 component (dihydrolipoamide succinyltransferase)
MSIEVKVPVLPESVSDATIASWHKQPGETINRDENLVDLETDKVVLEVPAPVSGTLKKIIKDSGETVTSNELLAIIDEGVVTEMPVAGDDVVEDVQSAPSANQEATAADTEKLSPAVRRIVAEEQVAIENVPATGRSGRISKADVVNYLAGGAAGGTRHEERVPMSRLRTRIAERMKDAQNTAAILTSFNEVNLQAVVDLRKRYQQDFKDTHGIKLGFMSFFVRACCEALKKFPVVNASLDGTDIVYHNFMDIGIAVSTERGLLVPVVRNAEHMSLAEIERQIAAVAGRARDGSISLEDLQGGTFSITNGGVFGSLLSTPLLNPPQSAILGMHAIKERPVVEAGEIVARPMMYLALSYDHRIIDGKDSVQFLVAVKDALEEPSRLLLNL